MLVCSSSVCVYVWWKTFEIDRKLKMHKVKQVKQWKSSFLWYEAVAGLVDLSWLDFITKDDTGSSFAWASDADADKGGNKD